MNSLAPLDVLHGSQTSLDVRHRFIVQSSVSKAGHRADRLGTRSQTCGRVGCLPACLPAELSSLAAMMSLRDMGRKKI